MIVVYAGPVGPCTSGHGYGCCTVGGVDVIERLSDRFDGQTPLRIRLDSESPDKPTVEAGWLDFDHGSRWYEDDPGEPARLRIGGMDVLAALNDAADRSLIIRLIVADEPFELDRLPNPEPPGGDVELLRITGPCTVRAVSVDRPNVRLRIRTSYTQGGVPNHARHQLPASLLPGEFVTIIGPGWLDPTEIATTVVGRPEPKPEPAAAVLQLTVTVPADAGALRAAAVRSWLENAAGQLRAEFDDVTYTIRY